MSRFEEERRGREERSGYGERCKEKEIEGKGPGTREERVRMKWERGDRATEGGVLK